MLDENPELEKARQCELHRRPGDAEMVCQVGLRTPRDPALHVIEESEQHECLALGQPQVGNAATQEPSS